jgi:hypothetical protein
MRFWLWLGARLVIAAILVGWGLTYLMPGGGEKEFQRALTAMKQVQSVRYSMVVDPSPKHHSEGKGELTCQQDAFHSVSHMVLQDEGQSADINEELVRTGDSEFRRQADGSWRQTSQSLVGPRPGTMCRYLVEGFDTEVLPPMEQMLKRGIIDKGEKKTVDGVRCREWKVTMRGEVAPLERRTVCLGLDDHLPREMTVDWNKARWTYSDYNAPIAIEVPTVTLQQTSVDE